MKTGTREWSNLSANCCLGCKHGCHYCYAKASAIRFGRISSPTAWERHDIRWATLDKALKKKPDSVMFPTTHDIHPDILDECIHSIAMLLHAGHRVLIVSKPHTECIEEICKYFGQFRNRLMFRFSIGSAYDHILRLWEPNAPCFEERLECLRIAYRSHFRTSVSIEPILDAYTPDLVKLVGPRVSDTIWLGKPNALFSRLSLNCAPHNIKGEARELLTILNDDYIHRLVEKYKGHPAIRFKDSIRKVVDIPEEPELEL